MRHLFRACYGSYAWIVLAAIVVPTTLLLSMTPSTRWSRRIARRAARTFFICIGSPIRIENGQALSDAGCIIVANHASYLDGLILTAALPASFTFVIKHEMATVPVASLILRRLGSEFVDRHDDAHRRRVARRLLDAARSGAALAVFPEATFDAEPGLKRFQLGAFRVAWRTAVPLVPVVIEGARYMLGAGCWLPTPARLSVRICEPLRPDSYPCPRTLMLAARRSILDRLPEPDLGPTTEPSAGDERETPPAA
jgi:1-acyl-sn-glycerol-3-phosphate acyltransferase